MHTTKHFHTILSQAFTCSSLKALSPKDRQVCRMDAYWSIARAEKYFWSISKYGITIGSRKLLVSDIEAYIAVVGTFELERKALIVWVFKTNLAKGAEG
ncbi:MAG: hypothetical protein JTT13_09455 [Candidatus Brockarchaeota archaeon]|nr:hypothetical protein [Candidatus Brockarchaeota archaeon]